MGEMLGRKEGIELATVLFRWSFPNSSLLSLSLPAEVEFCLQKSNQASPLPKALP